MHVMGRVKKTLHQCPATRTVHCMYRWEWGRKGGSEVFRHYSLCKDCMHVTCTKIFFSFRN